MDIRSISTIPVPRELHDTKQGKVPGGMEVLYPLTSVNSGSIQNNLAPTVDRRRTSPQDASKHLIEISYKPEININDLNIAAKKIIY